MGFGIPKINIPLPIPPVVAAAAKVVQPPAPAAPAPASAPASMPTPPIPSVASVLNNPIAAVAAGPIAAAAPIAAVLSAVAPIVPKPSLTTQLALMLALNQAVNGDYTGALASATTALDGKSPKTLNFLPTAMEIAKVNKSLAMEIIVTGLNLDGQKELADAVVTASKVADVVSGSGVPSLSAVSSLIQGG